MAWANLAGSTSDGRNTWPAVEENTSAVPTVPPTLHFSAHGVSPSTVDALLAALTDAVTAARAAGPARAVDLSALDLSTVDEDGLVRLLTETGLTLATMAPVNATLDPLPPAAREHLLEVFLSVLLSPGG